MLHCMHIQLISSRQNKLCMKTLLNEDEFQETAQLSHCFFCGVLQPGVTAPCSALLQTMCILRAFQDIRNMSGCLFWL